MNPLALLARIERAGNKLPNPTLLFIYLSIAVLIVSALSSFFDVSAKHPISGVTITAINLISIEGLHLILKNTVTNFVQFAPVGTALVAVLGIGIAEHSGLLNTVLKVTIQRAPNSLLSFFVVFAGVLSSLAMDTGYVILIPLAAIIFLNANRNPLIGIAAAFAGVSGGFSANLLIGPIDAILSGISTEAAQLVQPGYEVNAAGNYYFIVISTFVLAITGAVVTEKIISPRYDNTATPLAPSVRQPTQLSPAEQQGLRAVGLFSVIVLLMLLAGLLPEQGVLRNPENGSITSSPFMSGIITIIALYAGIAGWIFGKFSGAFTADQGIVTAMEKTMGTMAGYLVLMFFAAQFVSYFNWSQLGSILAIHGAQSLQALALPPMIILLTFIIMTAGINLFIGSASAKWALMAPIFVPMLMLAGITPEATQMAFRIGDSSTNIITPLMPYFGLVVAYAQRYQKDLGVGTIIAMMLPFSVAFLLVWSSLFALWLLLDLPIGPGIHALMT
jgi:aminobenzoyl-glutamate transport protein